MKLIASDKPIERRYFIEKPIDADPITIYQLIVDKTKKEVIELRWNNQLSRWQETSSLTWAIISGNTDFIEVDRDEALDAFPAADVKINMDELERDDREDLGGVQDDR